MTSQAFREIALSFPETSESAHMNHPDFRVGGHIFATLNYPNEQWGMVRLPPEEQEAFVGSHRDAFVPVKGAWGRQGCTSVRLEGVDDTTLHEALAMAWQDASRKKARKKVTSVKSRSAKRG